MINNFESYVLPSFYQFIYLFILVASLSQIARVIDQVSLAITNLEWYESHYE